MSQWTGAAHLDNDELAWAGVAVDDPVHARFMADCVVPGVPRRNYGRLSEWLSWTLPALWRGLNDDVKYVAVMRMKSGIASGRVAVVQHREIFVGEDQLVEGSMFDRRDGPVRALAVRLLGMRGGMSDQYQAKSEVSYPRRELHGLRPFGCVV